MFLSGGVDSSAIAAIMKRNFSGPVKTFAVGYQEAEFSELSYARHVAQAIGTEHHEVVVGMEDFFNALPRLIWHEDEPITWPSSVCLNFVSKLAREHVTVVLTGEGSDEMFGGYGRYHFYALNQRWLRYYRMLPGPVRRAIRSRVASTSLLKADLRRKLQHTFVGRGEDLESLYLDNFYSAFSATEQSVLFHSRSTDSSYGNFRRYWESTNGRSPLDRMLYTDQKTYLVALLMKQDRMSMAASIESRVPFLDHALVEFAISIPQHLQLGGFSGKRILKKAVADLLPRLILDRPKLGFPTPWSRWLAGPQLDVIGNLLLEPRSLARGLFQPGAIARLFQEHRTGHRDHYDRIWRLLNLELWQRVCLEKGSHAPVPAAAGSC
jgi:asparagine synthase (glutamine-hydrolysing)